MFDCFLFSAYLCVYSHLKPMLFFYMLATHFQIQKNTHTQTMHT